MIPHHPPPLRRAYTAIALVIVVILGAGPARAGRRDRAGSPPSWAKRIDRADRFVVLREWQNLAVLDRETGLVWLRSPSEHQTTWKDSQTQCLEIIAERGGWRVPTIDELSSLLLRNSDQAVPALPGLHPFSFNFIGGYSARFWSSTAKPKSNEAFGVDFDGGGFFINPTVELHRVWCVRGPGSAR